MTPSLHGHDSEVPSVNPMPENEKKTALATTLRGKTANQGFHAAYTYVSVYGMIMLREGTKKRPSVLRSWYTIGIETASDVIKVLPVKARNRMRHTHHRSCFHSKRAHPFMLHSVCIAIVLVPALCVAGFTKLASMRSMSLMQRDNTPR